MNRQVPYPIPAILLTFLHQGGAIYGFWLPFRTALSLAGH